MTLGKTSVKRPWRLMFRRVASRTGKWSVLSCYATEGAAEKAMREHERDSGPMWEIKLECVAVPSPSATEQALATAKQHINILTRFWMDNGEWAEACKNARVFVAGIPTSPADGAPVDPTKVRHSTTPSKQKDAA